MLVLAFDTSTAATSVGLVDCPSVDGTGEARELAAVVEVAANRHGELLAPLIRRCVADAGAALDEIGLVAVGTGPGPFTGLRAGLVTARSLGDALGVEVRGVCSLDVVADRHHHRQRPLLVVADARRREVYWAAYDGAGSRLEGPAVDRPAELAARFAGPTPGRPVLVGAGAALHRDAFAAYRLDERDPYPLASHLAALAGDPRVAGPPEPRYLRRPDARPPGRPKAVTPA